MAFQAKAINWSKRGRGNEALNRINKQTKTNVFKMNQTNGGRNGPSQPPKKRVTIKDEIKAMPRYSPTKNMPNFIPEYSEW